MNKRQKKKWEKGIISEYDWESPKTLRLMRKWSHHQHIDFMRKMRMGDFSAETLKQYLERKMEREFDWL